MMKNAQTPDSPSQRLFEISAFVRYNVVIAAETRDQALAHVKTWNHAWDAIADLIEVTDVEVVDERIGRIEDAHEVV